MVVGGVFCCVYAADVASGSAMVVGGVFCCVYMVSVINGSN